MSRNDPEDYAQRLYARVPAHYRVYDAEQGRPLLSLLRLVGRQASHLRRDLDGLWDDFFIETCADWVVPYLGALVGTNLLARPVGQSNRLDVRNTVAWRRSKGTPAMLRALAAAISGWPTDLAEFFQHLGWSQLQFGHGQTTVDTTGKVVGQPSPTLPGGSRFVEKRNLNAPRTDRLLFPDLRDPARLDRLGRADDPFAHAADFRPARPLDQARVTPAALGVGRAAWGTPGRHQIKALGFFVRPLQTFRVSGATPAAAPPGLAAPANAACFTFDPLFRDAPLFVARTGASLTRAAFAAAPAEAWGTDVTVRQFGVPLAAPADPRPALSTSRVPFTFGGAGAGLTLHAAGLRLMGPRAFAAGGAHFVLTAAWQDGDPPTLLGSLSTYRAGLGQPNAYQPGSAVAGLGRLVITVEVGRGWPGLTPSPPGRFPGAVLAVRADRSGPARLTDGQYVYLPPAFVAPGRPQNYYVADDGSTFTTADLAPTALARESEGGVFPARSRSPSSVPAGAFLRLNRTEEGLRLADPDRFGGAEVLVRANLFTGAFQPLGAVATVDQPASGYPELEVPTTWPALRYGPSKKALSGDLPDDGLLSIQPKSLTGDFVPAAEVIVGNRRGQGLLVYLPEVPAGTPEDVRLFVADDGSTWYAPADNPSQQQVLKDRTFAGLVLARAGAGQVLPVPGVWPLQQRVPVALNLCRCERHTLLRPGELGIDPELGRFAFAPADPAIGKGGLRVDYVEAFGDRVGARTYDRQLDGAPAATRLVAQSGDADSPRTAALPGAPIHATVAAALAAAQEGDVIEVIDSATYASGPVPVHLPAVQKLTLRAAAGQRPCLTFYDAGGAPAVSSLRLTSPLDELELNGLLLSGGPLRLDAPVARLRLIACTLDPLPARDGALIALDPDRNRRAAYLLCRCISGGLRLGAGVGRVTIADSVVDAHGGLAIGGLPLVLSPPAVLSPPGGGPPPDPPAGTVQLERVTVLGRVRCDVLHGSEALLDGVVVVEDQQAGCLRFSRWELGSVLPRRFQCVPDEEQARACRPPGRCLAPLFNARRFGRPDYAQLAAACPPPILSAGEEGGEVGAFAGALNPLRLANLTIKLQEFLPVGLSALVIAEP